MWREFCNLKKMEGGGQVVSQDSLSIRQSSVPGLTDDDALQEFPTPEPKKKDESSAKVQDRNEHLSQRTIEKSILDQPKENEESQSELLPVQPSFAEDSLSSTTAPVSDQASTVTEGGDGQCYCGSERNLNTVELQCAGCLKWFHQECITHPIGKCVAFMYNYHFLCKICNTSGFETFTKKQASFSQMCVTSIANLLQQNIASGSARTMFSKDKEIIPFIEKHWEHMTTMARRVKQTWHTTVHKTMLKDTDIFTCEECMLDGDSSETYPLFGLVSQNIKKIAPCYETPMKPGQSKNMDLLSSQNAVSGFFGGKGRGAKRKFPVDGISTAKEKKAKSDLVIPKLPPHGFPLEHPFNNDGFRYILAEPDPHAPCRQEFEESEDWAGKPIPRWLYRTLVSSTVLLAMHDRAPQLKISDDRLSVTGEKGYCMVRATHGVKKGTWYFECTIEDMAEGSATRLGWSQALGNLQAPLGYDHFSYSWRSKKGTKFHQSRGYHYTDGGYSQGDTLGFLIHLPVRNPNIVPLPPTHKEKVSVNFGPNFKHPPKDTKYQGMYEAGFNAPVEYALADILYLVEHQDELRLEHFLT
ncbi:set1/Ash2 histone methyltransferase complex subunit ASH2-like isoform X9 [Tachypleus tridentatus]|uniref:set1/Ash2 histone methyltransferase complex subunit ASH2-like isoform X9 n=2 Tax=Tachypleus tridentatus TaxID=6853 RepID=UPI003FD14421